MIYPTYEELDNIITAGRKAFAYAEEHYAELCERKTVYKLYGPQAYGMGAASPFSITKSRQRKLKKQPKQKDHIVYELDGDFKVLRMVHMQNGENHATCHFFEMDGAIYSRIFQGDTSSFYKSTISYMKLVNGVPFVCGEINTHSLSIEYYEPLSTDDVLITGVSYYPAAKLTVYGVPTSFDVPFNNPASPVCYSIYEGDKIDIDFSKYFKED